MITTQDLKKKKEKKKPNSSGLVFIRVQVAKNWFP